MGKQKARINPASLIELIDAAEIESAKRDDVGDIVGVLNGGKWYAPREQVELWRAQQQSKF
jgi:hypothetical protein